MYNKTGIVVLFWNDYKKTRLGYDLGSRNLIDLLQAERNSSETQNRLSQAMYGFIVTSLQYKQAIGTLRPEDIVKINEQFN